MSARRGLLLTPLVAAVALAAACGGSGGNPAPTPSAPKSIQVTSQAFQSGGDIPSDYGCDGSVGSPDLEWTGVPGGAKSLVVLANDPDASNFVHWLVYAIPPDETTLPWGISNEPKLAHDELQGKNSFGDTGYGPLCPPKGSKHTYQFFVYALDTALTLSAGASENELPRRWRGTSSPGASSPASSGADLLQVCDQEGPCPKQHQEADHVRERRQPDR